MYAVFAILFTQTGTETLLMISVLATCTYSVKEKTVNAINFLRYLTNINIYVIRFEFKF